VLNTLSDALLSRDSTSEYREAVCRALRIHDCKVLPFFGTFLQDLCSILSTVPGIVVFASDTAVQAIDVRTILCDIKNSHSISNIIFSVFLI